MGGSVYPGQDKLLTHAGDTGGDAPGFADDDTSAEAVAYRKKRGIVVKPQVKVQLLDSTGKMSKDRALANGYDRKSTGRR